MDSMVEGTKSHLKIQMQPCIYPKPWLNWIQTVEIKLRSLLWNFCPRQPAMEFLLLAQFVHGRHSHRKTNVFFAQCFMTQSSPLTFSPGVLGYNFQKSQPACPQAAVALNLYENCYINYLLTWSISWSEMIYAKLKNQVLKLHIWSSECQPSGCPMSSVMNVLVVLSVVFHLSFVDHYSANLFSIS